MSVSLAYKFASYEIYYRDDAKDVLFFGGHGLHVDGDGSPRCYGPKTPPALDWLANAGSPGNWWGIVTDKNGKPVVQKDSDPYPGLYVSTTSLADPAFPTTDPRHWVNSETVPFFVLPGNPGPRLGAKLGDLGMSFNLKTGGSSWWTFADVGPSNKLGEGSIALHAALGMIPPDWDLGKYVQKGGTESPIIVSVLFRNSTIGWPRSNEELAVVAASSFQSWGGLAELESLMHTLDWSKFPLAPEKLS